jgi:hypothetical protein
LIWQETMFLSPLSLKPNNFSSFFLWLFLRYNLASCPGQPGTWYYFMFHSLVGMIGICHYVQFIFTEMELCELLLAPVGLILTSQAVRISGMTHQRLVLYVISLF